MEAHLSSNGKPATESNHGPKTKTVKLFVEPNGQKDWAVNGDVSPRAALPGGRPLNIQNATDVRATLALVFHFYYHPHGQHYIGLYIYIAS